MNQDDKLIARFRDYLMGQEPIRKAFEDVVRNMAYDLLYTRPEADVTALGGILKISVPEAERLRENFCQYRSLPRREGEGS